MNSRTVLALAAVLIVLCVSAHAQAAAEAALANAHSSTSAVNAGSALGRALNRGSSQLAGRIQQVAPASGHANGSQARAQVSALAEASASRSAPPTGSSLIVAVHGAQPPACVPTNQNVQGQNALSSANPRCGSKILRKAQTAPQYKSNVTVAFPKQ